MPPPPPTSVERLTKGVNLLGLVKMLRVHRREDSLVGLAEESLALIEDRVLVSSWYPLARLHEMLDFTFDHLLDREPKRAIEIGRLGGLEAWGGAHRAYIRESPLVTLMGLPSSWPAYFNFGRLSVAQVSEGTVELRVGAYSDMPEVHGLTIVGWHLAAASLAGASRPRADLVRGPWTGDAELVYRLDY